MAGKDACTFCNIVRGEAPDTTLLFQDEEVVVFRDIRPAATHHYLVATKEHIRDAKQLTGQHVQLVEKLRDIGKQVLSEQGGDFSQARLGFHWPPFHLVSHLHLHVISPESELGFIQRGIFRQNSYWFITVDWLLERLTKMAASASDAETDKSGTPID